MTTTPVTTGPKLPGLYRLPNPPERAQDEKLANFISLSRPGFVHHLAQHLGDPESTLLAADLYITTWPRRELPSGATHRVPDLLVAFEVDPAAYRARNGYVIEEQGKPPDFVLEVASPSTASEDTGAKRADYEALGIVEYWRFDETGEHHGAHLAGDRLEGGVYVPIEVAEKPDGVLEGYSEALGLRLRWTDGALGAHDPETSRHIATFRSERDRANSERDRANSERDRANSERDRANSAEARANSERDRANSERDRADSERDRANSAEAQIRELKAELRRRRGG